MHTRILLTPVCDLVMPGPLVRSMSGDTASPCARSRSPCLQSHTSHTRATGSQCFSSAHSGRACTAPRGVRVFACLGRSTPLLQPCAYRGPPLIPTPPHLNISSSSLCTHCRCTSRGLVKWPRSAHFSAICCKQANSHRQDHTGWQNWQIMVTQRIKSLRNLSERPK